MFFNNISLMSVEKKNKEIVLAAQMGNNRKVNPPKKVSVFHPKKLRKVISYF